MNVSQQVEGDDKVVRMTAVQQREWIYIITDGAACKQEPQFEECDGYSQLKDSVNGCKTEV